MNTLLVPADEEVVKTVLEWSGIECCRNLAAGPTKLVATWPELINVLGRLIHYPTAAEAAALLMMKRPLVADWGHD